MTQNNHDNKHFLTLFIGALGVVYGDIGTSPLYTLKDCFGEHQFVPSALNVLGVMSLIFWSITLVVSIKYISIILRADNNGEGGILSLMALTLRDQVNTRHRLIFILGIVGASLFYGDAVITPAISVLSAVEGLSVASPGMAGYIIPSTIVVLIFLFWIQANGTASIGSLFGPAMLFWFVLIGAIGAVQIYNYPDIFRAVNPYFAYLFLASHGIKGITIFGSVVLSLTGVEALYADLGHFGRSAIQRSWFVLVFPALILNYFGQGAVILQHPSALENPFYSLVPTWGVFPLIAISTAATVIASQAVISGIFSMSWQAIQLGYLPRMRVIHTSSQYIGQVFVPTMNFIILFLTVALVILFKTSNDLASAYGLAVTGIMLITTVLTSLLAYYQWEWSLLKMLCIFPIFLVVDTTFFVSNSSKIIDGGWMPLTVAVVILIVVLTWVKGKSILNEYVERSGKTIKNFVKNIDEKPPVRIPGVAVYMSSTPENIPNALTINFKHNKVLHEKVIFLSIITKDVPRISKSEKIHIRDLGFNIFQVICYVGFKEVPNVNSIFERCDEQGLCMDLSETTFFMSRGIPVASIHPHMAAWRERLFIWLAKNAMHATEFYKIPHHRVVELGVRLKL